LLPYGILSDVRISEYIASNNKILNYQSVGRKQFWHNLMCYCDTFLERPRRTFVRIAGLQAKV
jgi:hypothetical protein